MAAGSWWTAACRQEKSLIRSRPKVLVTRPIQQSVMDKITVDCDVRVHPVDEPMPAQVLLNAVRDADGLLASGVQVSKEIIDAAPKLRVVSTIAVGYDNIDVAACTQRGILVTNTPDVLTEATADIAFVLLLATARRVVEGDRYVRAGRWSQWQWNFLWGVDIQGKTLGLYGFGRIAQATARRGRGFGLRILYHARHRAPEHTERELSAEYVDRETLLRNSDFLSLHVPLTSETRHSLAAPEFGLMKPSAFLINTARGPIVDEQAMIEALLTGKIAGAGLDVFENEPTVNPALIAMDNVTLLPHIGSATTETRLRMAELAADNLLAGLRGERPLNLLNPEAFS
jgi:lactate dehydrogenase-like 2-hydroxyacid dehydrogenase